MFTLNCKGRLLVAEQPLVMGIINSTPDSFYEGSRAVQTEEILAKADAMLKAGATILDIGGQSTRPGSSLLSASEEAERVLPAIEAIVKYFPESFISIDTWYAAVARQAVDAGASIVNDVSAADMDTEMISTVAKLNVPYIIMHKKGMPQTMQANPIYENVVAEVFDYLMQKKETCKAAGIHDIIIDTGFGFGKTATHNFELLRNLSFFTTIGPVLAGLSRKGTIYKTLGVTADEALNGTTVLNTIALMNGASILRVHDVKEAKEAVTLYAACYK